MVKKRKIVICLPGSPEEIQGKFLLWRLLLLLDERISSLVCSPSFSCGTYRVKSIYRLLDFLFLGVFHNVVCKEKTSVLVRLKLNKILYVYILRFLGNKDFEIKWFSREFC